MNKLKIYLRTQGSIDELIKAYQKVFDLQVVKKSFLNKQDAEHNKKSDKKEIISYAYLKLFNDISIMIASHHQDMPHYGYSHDNILYLSDNELFLQTYQKIKASDDFTIDYHPRKYEWGTTIFKAYDKWNNGWVIETRIA